MQEIQDVALSPTGRFAAYTVRRVVPGSRREAGVEAAYQTQLMVTPTSGRSSPRLLTRGGKGARQPTWDPDGSHLAFVRPVEGTPQVFIISLSGGEPYQLTAFPHGVQNPQWSPDGEHILFASAVPKSAVQPSGRRAQAVSGPRQAGRPVLSERPGRAPGDLVRSPPPDTVVVLRHAQTLDPVDTLDLGPKGRLQLQADTARALRTPGENAARARLAQRAAGRLNVFSPDSLRAVLDSLRLRPDTTALPVVPDTAATPNGTLIQTRRWLNQSRRGKTALVSTRLELQQGTQGGTPVPKYRHHFTVEVPSPLQGRTPARPRPEPVTGGYRTYGQAEWLSGSSQIVVSGTPPSDRPIDRVQRRNLYVVDLNRDRIQRLLKLNRYTLTAPTLTDDGSKVAFRVKPLASTRDHQAEVGLFAIDGRSEPRIFTSELDRDVGTFRWSPEGWYLYATAPSRGGVPLYRFSPFTTDTSATPSMSPDQATSRDTFALDSTMVRPAPHQKMTDVSRAVHDFNVTTASVVYTATGPDTPSALYANTVNFSNERRLSTHNAEWLSRRRLATPRRVTVPSGSLAVNGWFTRPVLAADSLQHPLLVMVRGGPSGADGLYTPEAWFERQYLAAQGFAFVEALPRGASGYGLSVRRANRTNWGPGPAQDVLAVADSAATRPWTDASRQVLAGASYSGTLTAWLIAHTDRFDAAVALNGAYDPSALLGTAPSWRLVPQEFGGYPWEGAPSPPTGPPVLSVGPRPSFDRTPSPWMALHRNAPIAFADQIHTPLLLLQGGADRQVRPEQSERLYKRLKILGRPAEYVRYPGVGHEVAASAPPTQRLDRLVRTYEFLARFLVPPALPSTPRSADSLVP